MWGICLSDGVGGGNSNCRWPDHHTVEALWGIGVLDAIVEMKWRSYLSDNIVQQTAVCYSPLRYFAS